MKGEHAPFYEERPEVAAAIATVRLYALVTGKNMESGDIQIVDYMDLMGAVTEHYLGTGTPEALARAIKQKARSAGAVKSVKGQRIPNQRDVQDELFDATAWDIMEAHAFAIGTPIAFWEWGFMAVGDYVKPSQILKVCVEYSHERY